MSFMSEFILLVSEPKGDPGSEENFVEARGVRAYCILGPAIGPALASASSATYLEKEACMNSS